MLKGLDVLEKKIEDCIESTFTYDKYSVCVKFNNYIRRNGEVTRVYINIYMRNLRNRKRANGTIGYYDLNSKSFVSEGRIYSSGLTEKLQEICKAIEIDEDAVKEEFERIKVRIKIVKIDEQIKELQGELQELVLKDFNLLFKVKRTEEVNKYISDIREKENLIKEKIKVLSQEREGLEKSLS